MDVRKISLAIGKKNQKARKYNWNDADECWLLITASGAIVSNLAARPVPDESWIDANLWKACSESPFHRIIFWERTNQWYKWLKPETPSVQYGDPGIRFDDADDYDSF